MTPGFLLLIGYDPRPRVYPAFVGEPDVPFDVDYARQRAGRKTGRKSRVTTE